MGKQVSSKDAIKAIEAVGWVLARSKGDHFTFKKEGVPMLITITHPVKSLSPGLVKDLERKTGIKF